MSSNPTKNGFSLIEVVLAIVVTSILMTAILGILVGVLSSAKHSEQLNASQKIGHAIINLIQRDLEANYLPPGAKDEKNTNIYFQVVNNGDFDSIDFVSAVQSMPNEENKRTPITEVGYRIAANEETNEDGLNVLFRREEIFSDEENPETGGKYSEIFDRITKFNITCFDGTQWLEYWDWNEKQKKIPLAVKFEIRISVEAGDLNILDENEAERIENQNTFITIISLPLGEKIDYDQTP